jgi:predicted enzyme related to lactoylglutathione lyase
LPGEEKGDGEMNKLELKAKLEEQYSHQEARIKKIECIYIPVTNAAKAKEFFMKHKLILLTGKGNVKFANGQGVFFLETRDWKNANFVTHAWDENNENHEMESVCFEVSDIHGLHGEMKADGARVTEMKDNGVCGWTFHFYDPDGNKYAAWQDK